MKAGDAVSQLSLGTSYKDGSFIAFFNFLCEQLYETFVSRSFYANINF